MNLKTDGAYYIGDYDSDPFAYKIFFDFESCASHESYQYITAFDKNGNIMGYLELIGGDYE